MTTQQQPDLKLLAITVAVICSPLLFIGWVALYGHDAADTTNTKYVEVLSVENSIAAVELGNGDRITIGIGDKIPLAGETWKVGRGWLGYYFISSDTAAQRKKAQALADQAYDAMNNYPTE